MPRIPPNWFSSRGALSFTTVAVTAVDEDSLYSYSVGTLDDDGDAVTMAAPTRPAWLGFVDNGDGTASLSGTPVNGDVGTHAVVLEISDGIAPPVQQGFSVTVANTNDAPTALSLSATTTLEHQPTPVVVGSFATTDVDAGDTFTYALVAGAGDEINAAFLLTPIGVAADGDALMPGFDVGQRRGGVAFAQARSVDRSGGQLRPALNPVRDIWQHALHDHGHAGHGEHVFGLEARCG